MIPIIAFIAAAVFDPFNWFGWPDVLAWVDGRMTSVTGHADWLTRFLASPAYKGLGVAILIGLLWRIGSNARQADKELVEQNSRRRKQDFADWDALVKRYFNEKRIADSTAALNRAEAALAQYQQRLERMRAFNSHYDHGPHWDRMTDPIVSEIRTAETLVGRQPRDLNMGELRPNLRYVEGAIPYYVFDADNNHAFSGVHLANQERLNGVIHDFRRELEWAREDAVQEGNGVDAVLLRRTFGA